MIVTAQFRSDEPTKLIGWWGQVTLTAMARIALDANTWPRISRESCRPSVISKKLGLGEDYRPRVKQAIGSILRERVLSVSEDRSCLMFDGRYFCEVDANEVGKILGLCKSTAVYPSEILFQKQTSIAVHSKIDPVVAPTGKRGKGRPRNASPQEQALFQMWRKGLNKNDRTRLDKKRLSAIRTALRQGFEMLDLQRSIQGWIRKCKDDPWRMEQLNRHELSLFLRDAAHIEEGIEYGSASHRDSFGSEVEKAVNESMRRREELEGHYKEWPEE